MGMVWARDPGNAAMPPRCAMGSVRSACKALFAQCTTAVEWAYVFASQLYTRAEGWGTHQGRECVVLGTKCAHRGTGAGTTKDQL